MLTTDLLDLWGYKAERMCVTASKNLLFATAGSDEWQSVARYSGSQWLAADGLPCSPVVIRCDEPLVALFAEQEIDRSEAGYEFFTFNGEESLYLHRPRGRQNVACCDGRRWATVGGQDLEHAEGLPLLLCPLSYLEAVEAQALLSVSREPRGRLSPLATSARLVGAV